MLSLTIVLAALLVSVLAYRLARLPAAFRARDNVNAVTAQALGQIGPTATLATQPAAVQWVTSVVGPTAVTAGLASNYYDPTKQTIPVTLNEFGFITSPSPAPVNPKTGAVPLTNADICAWVGHVAGTNPCARCGVPTG